MAALVGGGVAFAGPLARVLARSGAARLAQPGAGGAAGGGAAPAGIYTFKPLAGSAGDKLRISAIIGDGGNSLVAGGVGGGGADWALIIDTKNAPLGAMLRAQAMGGGGGDFSKGERLVINTHHHGDHTGGNWAFTQGEGGAVPILAHANALPRVLAQTKNYLGSVARVVKSLEGDDKPESKAALPFAKEYLARNESFKPEAWAPTRTITGEKNEITVGGVGGLNVEAYHFFPGHTDNDIILRLPEQNILHMGDLLFHKNWCFIDRAAGADTVGWMRTLGESIKLCDAKTVVIPGHGELTDVEGLKGQIAFFEKARAIVGDAIKTGTKREDVVKLNPPEFAERGLHQMRDRTLGAIFDELTGAPPAPPPAPPAAPAAPAPPAVPAAK